jgi:hypothetical protein
MSEITPEDLMSLQPEILRRWQTLPEVERAEHILSNSVMYQGVRLHQENMREMRKFFDLKQTNPESLAQLDEHLRRQGWI